MRYRRQGSVVYRSYEEIKLMVVSAIVNLIARTKGTCLTFTSKKLAQVAGLPTQPVLLTIVRDVLENLRREGLIVRYSKTSHGVKYMITKDSPLWAYAVSGECVELRTPYLEPVLAAMRGNR